MSPSPSGHRILAFEDSFVPTTLVITDRLDSWKEIGAYLGRDVRTVIRWEKEKGLPIHRIPGGQRQGVFAFRHELDAWLAGQDHGDSAAADLTNGSHMQAASPVLATPAPVLIPPAKHLPQTTSRWKLAIYLTVGLVAVLLLVAATYSYVNREFSLYALQLIGQTQLTNNYEDKEGLLTDGKELYFGQEQDGQMVLVAMPLDGGPIRILWNPHANVLPVDLSPDGRLLLAFTFLGVEREREMWIVPLDGGAPHRVSSLSAHSAAWEPDGKRIAFATEKGIFLTSEDGIGTREIGSFAAIPDALHWSEDGEHLRFLLVDAVTEKPSYWELASRDSMATTTLRSLTSSWKEYGNWARAPGNDADFLTGSADRFGNVGLWIVRYGQTWWEQSIQMFRLNLSLPEIRALTYDRASRRLFVLSGQAPQSTFIRFDPGTNAFREILPDVSGIDLDYSRDGQWIAYTTQQEDTLWVSRANGSAPRKLTSQQERIQLPRWSPDGKEIAYMAKAPDSPWRIFIQRLDTGERWEASEGDDKQGAPTWSPDGRFLVYGNVHCQPTHSCAIHRIDLSTGKVQMLPGSEGLFTARWSPDGRYIAALQPEQHQVFLFDVATRKWRKLSDAVDGTDMSWSADSKYVYVDIPGADARIVRIRAVDGTWETAADLRSQDMFDLTEVDDLSFSLAPDNAVILHHRSHSAEIYAYTLRSR